MKKLCIEVNSKRIQKKVRLEFLNKNSRFSQGDMIPIKIPLNTLNLTPSIRNKIEGCFSIQYHLKVALFNEAGAAFFRKVETVLLRGVDDH